MTISNRVFLSQGSELLFPWIRRGDEAMDDASGAEREAYEGS